MLGGRGTTAPPPSQQLDEKTIGEEQEETVVADQVELDADLRVDAEQAQKV